MAQYQILYWRHIPLGVKATDLSGTVRENLPPRFQDAIDNLAMQDGRTNTSDYTSMFRWSRSEEREGSAAEVVEAVMAELEAKWSGDIPLTPDK